MLSINFFRHVIPHNLQNNFKASRDWLIENKLIGNDAEPFALGYRIPTQGPSSMAGFIVADILPNTQGDVIVLADDFTTVTGSDFDIDKLYLLTQYYDVENNRAELIHCPFDDLPNATNKQLVNGLFTMYLATMTSEVNIAQTRAPLDSLTTILKEEILPQVVPVTKTRIPAFSDTTPSFQLSKKFEYSEGKSGIASFALHGANLSLTQATHLNLVFSKATQKRYNPGPLDARTGRDSRSIAGWLSAMINAHVDVAKDPYIINLNVNRATYAMTNALLRFGYGENTFYFLGQPILRELSAQLLESAGEYGVISSVSETKALDELQASYNRKA
ncbi:MAG: hypothetical protein EOM41_08180 [Bacilli bacterium]|nr:hypothetical protein [Bacilli bacterium]